MDAALSGQVWTAEAFLAEDQNRFGDDWRYELVDGRIVAHTATTPDHGAIVASICSSLMARLRGDPDRCRVEGGSGAAPTSAQRNTARIPDVMIRCGSEPRIVFEVISPSDLCDWRGRDRKRLDLQRVEGVQEIVEIYQDDMAAHVYRRERDGRSSFEAVSGAAEAVRLASMEFNIPLAEIHAFVAPAGPEPPLPT